MTEREQLDRSPHGQSNLHLAVRESDSREIASLIARGADVRGRDRFGQTPLHFARDAKIVDQLVDAGAEINAVDNNWATALNVAARKGRLAAVGALLNKGADVNRHNREGDTCVHWAVKGGNLELLQLLTQYGADVNAVNGLGQTGLHSLAALSKYIANSDIQSLANALVSAGADNSLRDSLGRTAEQIARANRRHGLADFIRGIGFGLAPEANR